MPTNSNAKLFNEWGAFAVIPYEFIDASTAYSDQAFRLFVLLMRYTNGKTGEAFPSYAHIQSITGWSTKTIAKAIRELETAGWIVRKKQFSGPTHYTLVRPHSFPTESNDSTFPGKGLHFPTERTALSQGKPKKNESKYIESKKKEPTAATPPAKTETAIDDLGDILEDAYPGHATNWRTMGELRELINRLHATRSDVLAFPAWLQRKYPLKANTPFCFKDLFPQMVREANATKPKASPSYCGECNNGWTLTESGATQCQCQRSDNENSTNRTGALVSAN
jgi:hypothetical protein